MESFSSITFRPDRVLDLVCNLQNFSKVNHIIFVNLKFRPDFSFSKNFKMFLLRFANIQKKNTKISWRYKFREFSELFPRLFRIILRQLFLLGYFFMSLRRTGCQPRFILMLIFSQILKKLRY